MENTLSNDEILDYAKKYSIYLTDNQKKNMTKEDFKELCKFVREKRNNEVYRMITVFDKKLFLSLAILIPIILYLLITSVMSFIYFEPTMVNISKWDNKDRATYLTITIILWIITFCFSFFKVEKNETN